MYAEMKLAQPTLKKCTQCPRRPRAFQTMLVPHEKVPKNGNMIFKFSYNWNGHC